MTQEEGANDHFWSECVESFGNGVGRGRIKVTPRHRHSHFPNILSFSMSFSRNSLVSREFPAWGDAWDNLPSRLRGYNQSFGLGLSEGDFFGPSAYYPSAALLRPRRQLSMTEVRSDADRFLVLLDVSHFTPEEITVKTVDDQVLIQGCHEEKVDEHGLVSRQFTRRYTLPPGVDPESVRSSLGAEGVLSVEAPRKRAPLPVGANERPVPITIQQPQTTSVPVQREEKTGEDKSK